MNKTLFTVYDTEFDLSEPKDCDQLVDMIEVFGAMHTWSIYDLICTVEQRSGSKADYESWMKDIVPKFERVINVKREICNDDCAIKTILCQSSPRIDHYFNTEGQAFMQTEQITLPGCANENLYIPVQRVEILDDYYPGHLVTRVLEPQRDNKIGLTRIGNVDNFSIMVFTVNIAGKITQQFGLQHPDDDAEITDSVHEIAQNLFDDYLSRQEAE